MTHRISAHILPLARITLRGSQLAIPMVTLPNFTLLRANGLGHNCFPILHPTLERWDIYTVRRTKKMNVIRHHDVASDEPFGVLVPCADDCCMTSRRCQNLSALRGTCSHINDNRTVMLPPPAEDEEDAYDFWLEG